MRRSATSSSLAPPLSAVDVMAAAAGARVGGGVFAVVWTICSVDRHVCRRCQSICTEAGNRLAAMQPEAEWEGPGCAECSPDRHAPLRLCAPATERNGRRPEKPVLTRKRLSILVHLNGMELPIAPVTQDVVFLADPVTTFAPQSLHLRRSAREAAPWTGLSSLQPGEEAPVVVD